MSARVVRHPAARGALGALLVTSLLAACSGSPATSSSPVPGSPDAASSTPANSPASATPTPQNCLATTAKSLSPEQRAGQLVMVALQAGSPAASLEPTISGQHVGNTLYLGGWSTGAADVAATSKLMQRQATTEATGGIPLLIAADQEGGVVQQLKGPGFTPLPSALEQAAQGPAAIEALGARTGAELKAAGVNINLAPVADVVPAELGKANGPIGQWNRQYGSTPAQVSAGADAFVKGLAQSGVAATLKHFPGIGRIRGNTDHTAEGIVDDVTGPDDPYLEPFRSGIAAGAQLVMLSSATYTKIDPDHPAMFSAKVIEDLLRGELGFRGVVITDDINAVAVRSVPVGERATSFIAAGGDMVLTGDTPSAPTLISAITDKAASDAAFAQQVDAALTRVLTLKQELGLICQ